MVYVSRVRVGRLGLAAFLSLGATAQNPTPPPQEPRSVHPQIIAPEIDSPAKRVVELPLLDCSGLPCVEMSTASGKTLRLLIDLAEPNSYLDSTAAQRLGVGLAPLQGTGDSAQNQVQQTTVASAKLGDLPMGDFPFMVLDVSEQGVKPGQSAQPFPADGALAFRAFQNRLLQIDYAHHVVHLSEPEDTPQACPHNCTALIVKHAGTYGPVTLTAEGFTLNNTPVDAQIDTLFTGTMLVYPGSIQKLDLKKASKAKPKEVFPYLQGGVKLARFDGAAEGFRDVTLAPDAALYFFTTDDNAPPAVPYDVTVGSGLLSHAMVSFDFKSMQMWME